MIRMVRGKHARILPESRTGLLLSTATSGASQLKKSFEGSPAALYSRRGSIERHSWGMGRMLEYAQLQRARDIQWDNLCSATNTQKYREKVVPSLLYWEHSQFSTVLRQKQIAFSN